MFNMFAADTAAKPPFLAVVSRRTFLQLLVGRPIARGLQALASRFSAMVFTELEFLFCFTTGPRFAGAG